MEKSLLFRCCLVKDFIGNHRFVYTLRHQSLTEVAPDATFLYRINFKSEFADGMLLTLLAKFGIQKTGEFMCELLQNGFDAIKPHYPSIMLNQDFAIQVPSPLNANNVEIVEYLEMMHGLPETRMMCSEIRCMGMNIIHHLSVEQVFGLNYAN